MLERSGGLTGGLSCKIIKFERHADVLECACLLQLELHLSFELDSGVAVI